MKQTFLTLRPPLNVRDKRVRIDDLDEVGSTLNNKVNMKWTFL